MPQNHEFSLGDRVELLRTPRNVQRGAYEVRRLMPRSEDGEPQYRIRSDDEMADRIVGENQICSRPSETAVKPADAFRNRPSPRMEATSMFGQYRSRVEAANNDRRANRPRTQRSQGGSFEQDFPVAPPGIVGLARLTTKLEALQRSRMIVGWSLGRWKNDEKTVHGVLFSSERDLNSARISIVDEP